MPSSWVLSLSFFLSFEFFLEFWRKWLEFWLLNTILNVVLLFCCIFGTYHAYFLQKYNKWNISYHKFTSKMPKFWVIFLSFEFFPWVLSYFPLSFFLNGQKSSLIYPWSKIALLSKSLISDESNYKRTDCSIVLSWRCRLKNSLLEVGRKCGVEWDTFHVSDLGAQVFNFSLQPLASFFNFLLTWNAQCREMM